MTANGLLQVALFFAVLTALAAQPSAAILRISAAVSSRGPLTAPYTPPLVSAMRASDAASRQAARSSGLPVVAG